MVRLECLECADVARCGMWPRGSRNLLLLPMTTVIGERNEVIRLMLLDVRYPLFQLGNLVVGVIVNVS